MARRKNRSQIALLQSAKKPQPPEEPQMEIVIDEVVPGETVVVSNPSAEVKTETIDAIEIVVPVTDQQRLGYCQRDFSLKLSERQSMALERLRMNLADAAERFEVNGALHADGRVVDRGVDAIRWLLDRVADGLKLKHTGYAE